jgi:putative membrane protein
MNAGYNRIMASQRRRHWILMLFEWRGSVLRTILPRLCLLFLISACVVWSHGYIGRYRIPLDIAPFTLSGVAISIFLGFRNSASYERFWEGRKLWGSLLNTMRSLARQGMTHAQLAENDPRLREWLALLAACAHALRHQLRGSDPRSDLERLLPAATVERVLAAEYRPAFLLGMLGEWVAARRVEGSLGEMLTAAFDRNLDELSNIIGGCERLANTPIPYGYAVIIHRTVYIYCLLLPFGLVDSLGMMTPVMATFIAYTFIALDTLAEELEEPFGTDYNDLPLEKLSGNIEGAVFDLAKLAAPS